MDKVKVRVINKSGIDLPVYGTPQSSGCDVRATEDFILYPHTRKLIMTGLFVGLPEGWEIQVRPKSGLAVKHGIIAVLGTVDGDYRGEIGVLLINEGDDPYAFEKGDKIAQLVVAPVTQIEWEEVEDLDETERGVGGFGSTGKK